MKHFIRKDGQYLFDKNMSAFKIVLLFVFTLFIYSPLLITGYWLATYVVEKNASVYKWIAVTVGFAYLCYLVVFFFKGLVIILRDKTKWLWILPFIFCVFYTCAIPGIIAYNLFHHSIPNHVARIAIGTAVGFYLYTRYLFLTNVAPVLAMPGYSMAFLLGRLFGVSRSAQPVYPLWTRNFFLANTRLLAW